MSETQVLLSKISALRQQLEQVRGLAQDATAAAASLVRDDTPDESRMERLEHQVAEGARHSWLLDSALRQLTSVSPSEESTVLPKLLTARARRILQEGSALLDQLRKLADYFEAAPDGGLDGAQASQADDPLAGRYYETIAMAETALRTVQAFPNAPSVQLRLCEGLEAILADVGQRVGTLTGVVAERRGRAGQIELLAELLTTLHAEKPIDIHAFKPLADAVIAEALQGAPLRFLQAPAEQPARFIACHSLTVAQVIVRLARCDPELRGRLFEPVFAALLHDVGMLSVPVEILSRPRPLDDSEKRVVEAHTRLGAELLTRLLPTGSWLAEAAAGHHERLDGTGYPAGARELQIPQLTRLLAVCDVYVALCSPRSHRRALDTRTALADTLLLAEQGLLDRRPAEWLLQLSFYPVGSAVELADGSVGVVVATNMRRRDLNTPARPVLALLIDRHGQPLATARHLDLAECEGHSIVRTLPAAERCERLGRRYPELV